MDTSQAVELPLGITPNVSASVYYQKTLGVVHKSSLDVVHRSPQHYRSWLERDRKDTPALRFGRMFHLACLEPDEFKRMYVVEPDFGDCRYKNNKDARNAWLADNAEKESLTADEHDRLLGMSAAILQHPASRALLRGGQSEVTLRWNDQYTNLACKARADYFIEDKGVVVDLKTTESGDSDSFARSVWNYRYHVQDALYRAGFAACGKPIQHFALVTVEKEPPYAVAVYTLDAQAVEAGYTAARKDIETMQWCLEHNSWPGYSSGVEQLSLPKWALRQ